MAKFNDADDPHMPNLGCDLMEPPRRKTLNFSDKW